MSLLIARLNAAPVATILQVVLTAIVAVVGGVITIINPDTLSFEDYVKFLGVLSVGNGLLGVGRGINNSEPPAKLVEAKLGTVHGEAPPPLH